MGWVRLWRCLVDCRARRPVARTTARRPLGAACLALVCAILAELRRRTTPGASCRSISTDDVRGASPCRGNSREYRGGNPVRPNCLGDPQLIQLPARLSSPSRVTAPDAPRIIAVMQTFALSAGSVVEASWEYNNTSLDAFSTRLVPPSSTAERWISFLIERNPDVPWPVGTYEVSVSLNGTSVQQSSIEVTE